MGLRKLTSESSTSPVSVAAAAPGSSHAHSQQDGSSGGCDGPVVVDELPTRGKMWLLWLC